MKIHGENIKRRWWRKRRRGKNMMQLETLIQKTCKTFFFLIQPQNNLLLIQKREMMKWYEGITRVWSINMILFFYSRSEFRSWLYPETSLPSLFPSFLIFVHSLFFFFSFLFWNLRFTIPEILSSSMKFKLHSSDSLPPPLPSNRFIHSCCMGSLCSSLVYFYLVWRSQWWCKRILSPSIHSIPFGFGSVSPTSKRRERKWSRMEMRLSSPRKKCFIKRSKKMRKFKNKRRRRIWLKDLMGDFGFGSRKKDIISHLFFFWSKIVNFLSVSRGFGEEIEKVHCHPLNRCVMVMMTAIVVLLIRHPILLCECS